MYPDYHGSRVSDDVSLVGGPLCVLYPLWGDQLVPKSTERQCFLPAIKGVKFLFWLSRITHGSIQ